ncbi:uncharacterized protein BDR25DRAFT_214540 [Lindgomyces ingoldianus]|uniref:Uncharacterized protein n=1 Tax=Lindgomyces ingoldianus TaxID=673940 RepID=A0ACB6R8A8_9PLEO|nr:uncharacterized protein BDR25DRAFT_214540 [Lindgomyces ingoldianus]KAF2474762.1 hypothetical protein BDR25DRAFT_214540 [Lindgomyces ingoldianus]
MSNVISRVVVEHLKPDGQQSQVLDIVLPSATDQASEGTDQLRRFPTEVRLMIFEELLIVWPKTVFRGAYEFGPLDKREFDEEIDVPWQILQTCRKYHDEAAPIMYGKNRFVFCTGKHGEPGEFWRFPVNIHYLQYVTDLGIYFRADSPDEQGSQRVAHFLKAISRRATNLKYLVVLVSSDRFYEAKCPWDILFFHHPVCEALIELIERRTAQHLKIRLHNGALLFPSLAHFLDQTFRKNGPSADRSLTFTSSCTCPKGCPHHPTDVCFLCDWPKQQKESKPIEKVVSHLCSVESCEGRMMEMQDDLFEHGILPLEEDSEGDSEGDDGVEFGLFVAGLPFEDDYDESRLGFSSGYLLPGQSRRYRSQITAPEVWSFRQMTLLEFFKVIEYGQYLDMVFGPAGFES